MINFRDHLSHIFIGLYVLGSIITSGMVWDYAGPCPQNKADMCEADRSMATMFTVLLWPISLSIMLQDSHSKGEPT